MDFVSVNQEQVFVYACIFGLFLGAYYDVIRIIRLVIDATQKQLFFLDVFYFFCCGILTFLFAMVYNSGEIRFYILAGEIIGWCVYHLTLGELTFMCSTALVHVLRKLNRWIKKHIFKPIFQTVRHLLCFLLNQLKKCARFPKKSPEKSKISLKDNSEIVYNSNKRFARPHGKKRPKKKINDSEKGKSKK